MAATAFQASGKRVKKPADLLQSHMQEAESKGRKLDEVCATPSALFQEAGDYDRFVENLAGSIIERNAQARKGPAGQQRLKNRGRKALGRVLQGLLPEK